MNEETWKFILSIYNPKLDYTNHSIAAKKIFIDILESEKDNENVKILKQIWVSKKYWGDMQKLLTHIESRDSLKITSNVKSTSGLILDYLMCKYFFPRTVPNEDNSNLWWININDIIKVICKPVNQKFYILLNKTVVSEYTEFDTLKVKLDALLDFTF